jgi:hypothetical protein
MRTLTAIAASLALAGCAATPATTAASPPSAVASAAPAAQTAATRAPDLAAADLTVNLHERSRKCFGSAGCNVEFDAVLKIPRYNVAPGDTWEITYSVLGLTDQWSDTITANDDGTYTMSIGNGETASSRAKLTAVVTGVRRGPKR